MATRSNLSILNLNPTWHPGPKFVHQLIPENGPHLALAHFEDHQQTLYTYDDLQIVSDAIAARLGRITENHEGQLVIPVLIEQSPILYASLLGILKAGGAFCPLNIDAPPERVAFILKDVSAPVILVSSNLMSRIPDEAEIESVVVEWSSFDKAEKSMRTHRNLSHDDLAYVMYTSGSTGTPKGVGISHSAVTQALFAHDRHVPYFKRFLQFAAPTFDVSVFEIFFPLMRGSTLVSAQRKELLEDLPEVVRHMNVDACELTPTVASGLLKTRSSVPKLKLLLTIGEMLTEPVIREFGGDDQTESILWAMYGPTEATIHCTLQTAMETSSSVKNIGVPLDTVSCFIIRNAGTEGSFVFEVLPIGEAGELAVGGYQLAQGYLNRAEQTAASFISTPYGRLYRTGDKARMLPNGTIECLGRLSDGQVKLRGQRMELGEVQEAILRTPGCRNAVAVVYGSNLVAFCAADADVLENAVLVQCKKWLPSFMIPSEVVLMDSLPQLPSGKVDRKKLVADFSQLRKDLLGNDSLDTQELPQELLDIVNKVLNCKVRPSVPLSSLGLDSLTAIQLSSSLRAQGFETDASTVLQTQTLSELWSMIQNRPDNRTRPSSTSDMSLLASFDDLVEQAPSIQDMRDKIEDISPCTPLQSAMLAESTQHSGRYWNEVEMATTYNDLQRAEQALNCLIRDNEILRTGFISTRRGFFSVILKQGVGPSIRLVEEFQTEPQQLLRPFNVQATYSKDQSQLRLLFTLHHAIYDGWSLDLMLDDLLSAIQGQPLQARSQFRQVLNYYQSSLELEKQQLSTQAYWAEHLLGWIKNPFPGLTGETLQSDPQPAATTTTLSVPYEQVLRTSQGLGCSVQTLFQASLALVWSGIVASEDIVIGSVTSGRTIPVAGIESVLGPCISSLPLRIDMAKLADVRQLLNHIHSSNRAMMGHCTLPLAEIRKLTDLQASQTLYDVLFAYQQSPKSSVRRGSELWEVRHVDQLETKLLVEVEPSGSRFLIQATYHRDVLTSDMVDSLIQQVETTLQALLDNTASSLNALQRRLQIDPSIFNSSPICFDGIPDLAVMVENTARRMPQGDAICFAEPGSGRSLNLTSITYSRLNSLANKIAHYLLSERLGTRQVIGIAMNKSITMYASILAILKIGCAYLPILPSTPSERMRKIFSQAKTRYCLTDRASADTLAAIRGCPRLVDVESAPLADFHDHNLGIAHDGSRLAYVIYTSGTTGEPKGVAVTQLNIASNIDHLRNTYPRSQSRPSRLLQACSQAFDVSVFEIFYAWHAGMCLCSGNNDTIFEDLEHAIRELEVTHLSLTPTVASLIDPEKTPSVEFLVTAGEPLTQPVLEAWGDRLWQGYGPSETTNICSVKRMKRGIPIEHLGFVFPNTSVFVAHLSTLEPVPFGWVGEFCYGGDQIAQGYLNMPNLTSERFIDHPRFGRVYRSGDVGRMLPDGSLIILGRVDDQLKLRGQRIEAGEINSIVASTGAAKSSVTIIAERPGNASKQLVSFYIPPGDITGCGVLDIDPSAAQLLFSALQAKLPSYMVPSYMVPLARIPLTSSGKLHRSRLTEVFQNLPSHYLEEATASLEVDDSHGDDWSELEATIADTISEHLAIDLPEIKRWTPFATLGVDSISAIGIARILTERLDSRVPVSVIIRSPNVLQLAQNLKTNAPVSSRHTSLALFESSFIKDVRDNFTSSSRTIEAVLPCTPLQEAMLSASSASYYNKILLRLNSDVDNMKSCWQQMVKRHQILRTCFVSTQDASRPVAQVVLQDWDVPWIHLVATKPSFDDVIREHTSHLPEPLDSKLPPISFATIRYRGSVFLSLICHHALYDGVAMDILWREVETLANGLSLPTPIPYEPFLLDMVNLPKDVEKFWRNQLHGTRLLRLFASSKSIDQTSTTKSLSRPLHATQNQLRSLSTSMLSLCQASWATTLSLVYQTSDVCFGNVVSGRSVDIEGIDRLAAPTFNTIPIRVDLAKSQHGRDLLKGLQRLNADVLPYQFTPLRLAQKVVGCPGRNLFETLLILQKPLHEMDDSVWILEEDSGGMDVPVVCEVVPCPSLDNIVVNLHYDANTVDSSTANALVEIFDFVKESMLQSPYAVLPTRSGIPAHLKEVIQTLRPRKERIEAIKSTDNSEDTWNSTKLDIRQAFAKLSGAASSRISQTTTMFQLGLDSINAVQIAAILRRKGYDVSASEVLAFPTCEKLGTVLLDSNRNSARGNTNYRLLDFSDAVMAQIQANLPSTNLVEAVLPCTPMQCAMIQSWLDSDGHNYFNTLTFEVDDAIDTSSLEQAWQRLFSLHPMLRTGFVQTDHPDATFAMVRYATSSLALPIARAEHTDLHVCLTSLRQGCLQQPSLPPWGVFLSESSKTTMMTLAIHHALYDAESLSQLLASLSQLLRGDTDVSVAAVEPSLSSLLSRSLKNHKDAEEFWKSKASRAIVNKFPTMTPLKESPGAMVSKSVTSVMSLSTLQEAAQEADLSIQAIIQASWARIISSYLGEDSVVFGVSLSGRLDNITKDAPFPCLVTVPVVVSNVDSNEELLRNMMEFNTEMHAHQFAPLSQVQKWLGHPASSVFDTLVSFRRIDAQTTPQLFKVVKDDPMVDYSVSLEIEAHPNDELRISITFKPDVLPEGQANLMLQQFDAVATHLALHPDGYESNLSNHALPLFSQLPPDIPDMKPPVQFLHQFVEERARAHPDKLALEFVKSLSGQRQRWTYRELDQIGNRVANMLANVASTNSIVAIHFDKCPEAYFSILGILKAGCSFVALDTTAPVARKSFILDDSQAPCVLTSQEHGLRLESGAKTAVISVSEDTLRQYSTAPRKLDEQFTAQSTCYCLYTSGTTGTPKGCEITHGNAVHAMMAFQHLFSGHWQKDSRWLQFAALHFDVSVLEQYWSWSVGIAVVAAPKEMILDDLTGSINQLGITHIDLTPSLARLTHPDEVPSLCRGVFITGGESLKQEILDVWGPKAVIYNAYGPTEATIGVTMYQRVPVNGRPSNIGRQFPNVGSYIFKPGTEETVLRGGVGELCVSGKLVGKGYLNRPDLTDERFPTLSGNGDRIYRTGDLVRVLHDGCFDFLGRADDQVKLRGQRLEIGEINHVVRGVRGIRDAATIVSTQTNSDRATLVAFFVADGTTKVQELRPLEDVQSLGVKAKEACRNQLPAYMVPTHCIQLPFIPLSVNNKADAKQLRELFAELSHEQLMNLTQSANRTSPQISDELLDSVVAALASFSNTRAVDISEESSIFDLGVDSISAIRLSTMLKKNGFSGATPALVLRNPIVSDLAVALSKTRPLSCDGKVQEAEQLIIAYSHRYRSLACRELDMSPDDIEYIAPCSALQEAMLSRAMAMEDTNAYFNSFDLSISPAVNLDELRDAWDDLVASEAVLRTRFVSTPSGFIQVATKPTVICWQSINADDSISQHDALVSIRKSWLDDNRSQIGRPLEFILVQGGKNALLRVHIFHAIYDGTSFDLMLSRIESALRREESVHGPALVKAFAQGPLWNHDSSKQFWEGHLRGWSSSPMPIMCANSSAQPHMAQRLLSLELVDQIRHKENVTLQSVMLALWTSVLHQQFPASLTLGMIVSGRSIDLPGVEKTIGPLFNTLPFFNQSLAGRTWASLIRQCHDFGSSVLSFQHVPLQKIQKWCSNGQPLFDTLFALQVKSAETAPTHDLWEVCDAESVPDYPLAFEVTSSRDGSLIANVVAQGHIADQGNLENMLDLVQGYLELMAEDTKGHIPAKHPSAEHAKPTNSIQAEILSKEATNFEWNDVSMTIREEAASLAGLETTEIEPTATMLQLGLDSIDVMKLSAKLRTRNIKIPASRIMQLQTIARIGASTFQTESDYSSPAVNMQEIQSNLRESLRIHGVDLSDVEEVLPATPLQESMVAAMLDSDFEWYFNHDVLRLTEDVDVARLRTAWDQVVLALPILRTAFFPIDDTTLGSAYCQVVFKQSDVWHESQPNDEGDIFDSAMAMAQQRAKTSSGRSGLFQLSIVQAESHNYVVISIAHALYDGWSLSLIYRELERAYNGLAPSTSSMLPYLGNILGQSQSGSKTFWADYLYNCLPTLVPQRSQSRGVVCKMEKKSNIPVSDIQTLCRQLSVSLQALSQACWAVVLAQLTGQLDITFGVVMSGRDFESSEDLVFPTMNTVAFRCILHGSVSDFLKYVEETMAGVRQHQTYSLSKALATSGVPTGGLFNSLFLLQKTITDAGAGDPLLKSVKGASAVDYPICVEAEILDGGLIWRTACQTDFMSEDDTQDLLRLLDQTMQFFVRGPHSEVIVFKDTSVSICGLPSTQLRFASGQRTAKYNEFEETTEPTRESLAIKKVLSQVSGVQEGDIQQSYNLYHLGLDSISAIKVASLLRREALDLTTRDIIRADNVGHLISIARCNKPKPSPKTSEQDSAKWAPPPSLDVDSLILQHNISPADVEATLPALPMQVYMLGTWQNSQRTVFYPDFPYTLHSDCGKDEIEIAWGLLMQWTPILRTRFISTGLSEMPVLQVILRENTGNAMVHFKAERDEDGHAWHLNIKIHHALYDGVSLPAIMQKLAHAIGLQTQDDSITTSSSQADALAPWTRYTTNPTLSPSRSGRKDFWTRYLSGCPGHLPLSEPRTGYPIKRVSYVERSAVRETANLRHLAANKGVSIQSLFLAAYAKVLSHRESAVAAAAAHDDALSGERDPHEDVVFGIYYGNRSGEDVDGLSETFPRLSLVPLRVGVGGRSLVDAALGIQEDLVEIAREGRADVGLWEIAEWTGVQIKSFVNFLSLPAAEEDEEEEEEEGVGLRLEVAQGAAATLPEPSDMDEIGDVAVRNAFPPALDVEASLRGSSLDIGVFAPNNLVPDEAFATDIVKDIVVALQQDGDA